MFAGGTFPPESSAAFRICGIDEAGRGPLAGPVYAAAVILDEGFPVEILDDSKKMTKSGREKAAALITGKAAWGIACAEASEIDAINILRASLLAMARAWNALCASFPAAPPVRAVIDGQYCPCIPIPCEAMVKADAKVPAVMAASILAKTARDRMMLRYSWLYPEYGYEKHKGYATKAHREALARCGPSPIQRHSFSVKPLQKKFDFS
ncbi:MAG: ribonuclease HII [Treponema sp.]|jgi:ribonuclease HII|nr:ribonuclease HII [Treponema sp.]